MMAAERLSRKGGGLGLLRFVRDTARPSRDTQHPLYMMTDIVRDKQDRPDVTSKTA